MASLKRVGILGAGMLGGSVALSLRAADADVEICLWGRDAEKLAVAKDWGVEVTVDLERAVIGCDLVIFATPVGAMEGLMARVVELARAAEGCGEGLVVTDVGSVKRLVHAVIDPLVEGLGIDFVGSHPMAGSEQTGLQAARGDLLDGAACLVTNDGGVAADKVALVEGFWQQLGCQTRRMSAEDHDYAVARVSHFPHVLASVGARVGLDFEDIAGLCGGGMRDTTRVAAGDPDLWTEILMENGDALQRSLRESVADLVQVMEFLEKGEREQLRAYLVEAKRKRDLLS